MPILISTVSHIPIWASKQLALTINMKSVRKYHEKSLIITMKTDFDHLETGISSQLHLLTKDMIIAGIFKCQAGNNHSVLNEDQ